MPCTRTGIPLRSIPAGEGHVMPKDIELKFSIEFNAEYIFPIGWFSYSLISNKAYVTAGITSWVIYATFVILCTFLLVTKRVSRLRSFMFTMALAYLVHICMWINDSERKTLEVAKTIQQKCNTDGRCPSELPGWKKINDNMFRKGSLYYYTGEYVDSDEVFTLFYHFGLDNDIWVSGGKDKDLTVSFHKDYVVETSR
jgi:hypothetical protein